MALRRKLELEDLTGHQDPLFRYAHEQTGAGTVRAHACHSASISDQSLGLRLPGEPFPSHAWPQCPLSYSQSPGPSPSDLPHPQQDSWVLLPQYVSEGGDRGGAQDRPQLSQAPGRQLAGSCPGDRGPRHHGAEIQTHGSWVSGGLARGEGLAGQCVS